MVSEARALALAALQEGGGGAATLRKLEERLGPLECFWRDRSRKLLAEAGLTERLAGRLGDRRIDELAARGWELARTLGYELLSAGDFPRLRELPEPPLLLFGKGDRALLAGSPSVAIVGARRASGYGLRVAHALAREVASHGVVVLSGLARGIDAAAHRGALDGSGATVAVLGSGPDVPYPPEHAPLQRRVEENGLVLTEHLPGTPPRPHHFPRRNRILVALSQALLVVEARLKSGTLTSVRWAADLGRDVLVVPGSIESPLSEGPLQLLREGATPVGSAAHVLEALGLHAAAAPTPCASAERLTPAEQRLLTLLDGGPLDLDDLVRASGEAPGRLLTLLLGLEVGGHVVRDDGISYRRCRRPGEA